MKALLLTALLLLCCFHPLTFLQSDSYIYDVSETLFSVLHPNRDENVLIVTTVNSEHSKYMTYAYAFNYREDVEKVRGIIESRRTTSGFEKEYYEGLISVLAIGHPGEYACHGDAFIWSIADGKMTFIIDRNHFKSHDQILQEIDNLTEEPHLIEITKLE